MLSTLHTNSTVETLVRLEQMGVARWMVSSALLMVVAQRLVRKLCPHCRVEVQGGYTLPLALPPADPRAAKRNQLERALCMALFVYAVWMPQTFAENSAVRWSSGMINSLQITFNRFISHQTGR